MKACNTVTILELAEQRAQLRMDELTGARQRVDAMQRQLADAQIALAIAEGSHREAATMVELVRDTLEAKSHAKVGVATIQ